MADKKWLLGSERLDPMPLGMHCKPWYKDKLPSKCFAKYKVLKFPTSLDSRRWRFVREGLDDFRKGCPPCEDVITHGPKKSFLPLIPQRVPQPPPPKSHKVLFKDAGLFSKLSPAQFERKKFMEDVEAHLNRHPLAMFPDLDEDIPAELLLKVLQVVDPDRRLEDTWAYCEGTRMRRKLPRRVCKTHYAEAYLEPPKKMPGACRLNLTPKELSKDFQERLSRPRRVPRGVREFCKWVASFGDLGIDEDFMMSLFDFSSECKRTYETDSIKKIHDIPPELIYSTELSDTKEIEFYLDEDDWETKLLKETGRYKRKPMKIRYGAWYLKPKFWKKLINDEPLIDPKVLEEGPFGKEPAEPDVLEELYGTLAFKDFILSKGYAMPAMIERLFARKGWTYDSVKTPMERAMRIHALRDDDDEEGEEEAKEEEEEEEVEEELEEEELEEEELEEEELEEEELEEVEEEELEEKKKKEEKKEDKEEKEKKKEEKKEEKVEKEKKKEKKEEEKKEKKKEEKKVEKEEKEDKKKAVEEENKKEKKEEKEDKKEKAAEAENKKEKEEKNVKEKKEKKAEEKKVEEKEKKKRKKYREIEEEEEEAKEEKAEKEEDHQAQEDE